MLLRPRVLAALLLPLLRHPFTAGRNAWRARRHSRDAAFGRCVGVASPAALLERIAGEIAAWKGGLRPHKPEVLWMFGYCQKPVRCACGEPRTRDGGVQRRFNPDCTVARRARTGICGEGGACRIGRFRAEVEGEWENLRLRSLVMLDELQMARHWRQELARQAAAGEAAPFVMEVCPLAFWIAEQALFPCRTPLGVAFFLHGDDACRGWPAYARADAGIKEPLRATRLDPVAEREAETFLAALVRLAGERDPGPQNS